MPDYIHSNITHKIIGGAMKVHSRLGNGFQEKIYQRCLQIEFNKAGLAFEREQSLPLYYDGFHVGTRRVDFLVEDKVIVELKAQTELTNAHFAQLLNYLVMFQREVGLLINFGEEELKYKRVANNIR